MALHWEQVSEQLMEVLEILRANGRLETDTSYAEFSQVVQGLVRDRARTRSRVRQNALVVAAARQFDSDAGEKGFRSVWWALLQEFDDYEVEALVLLARHQEVRIDRDGVVRGGLGGPFEQNSVIRMSLERAAQRRGIVHQDGYSNEHHQAELIDAGRKHQERVYKLTQMGKAFVDFILDERLVTSKGESPAPGAAGGSRDGQAGGAPFE